MYYKLYIYIYIYIRIIYLFIYLYFNEYNKIKFRYNLINIIYVIY